MKALITWLAISAVFLLFGLLVPKPVSAQASTAFLLVVAFGLVGAIVWKNS